MEEQPQNMAAVISSGCKVIITIATSGTDKRVRLGRIIEYDALNNLISVCQENDSICLIPLGSISSIEVLQDVKYLRARGK
ncbi:MAG: hypothetical protein M0Z55_05835 [Peptococcaceae bacterium]|nr:hypothetical protein [Peptococcaceae bacterium]